MLAHTTEAGNALPLFEQLHELLAYVRDAARDGAAAHEVELGLWRRVLQLGRHAFGLFLDLNGPGDLGPSVDLPDGTTALRLEQAHPRPYRSVFGDFTLRRTAYGSREGQRITLVPLDARLQLPESDYSYLLQQWDLALGCEAAFARVGATLSDVLGLKQSIDSLERMSRSAATAVQPFRQQRPMPQPEDEGELFVVSGDGKGIVMRRQPGEPRPAGRRGKGEKANQKRMATVGAVYSVDRHPRTAEEVVAALFRDGRQPGQEPAGRPEPVGKHVWASLSHEQDGQAVNGAEVVFGWLASELAARNPGGAKETVYLMDGQGSLWDVRRALLPWERAVEVLDLLHVTPRLWQAACLFHEEGSAAAVSFVRERLQRILEGGVGYVVGGLRQMGTKHRLRGSKKKQLSSICAYLSKNKHRMRYDVYLARGYPIASGVIEGACRHYVKDRMERAGMHWSKAGAQAMLDVRSEFLNGDWEGFHRFRIGRETERLYPFLRVVEELGWPMPA